MGENGNSDPEQCLKSCFQRLKEKFVETDLFQKLAKKQTPEPHRAAPICCFCPAMGKNGNSDQEQWLKAGFQRFKEKLYDAETKLFEELAKGQNPKYMVIACSDSRVCPSQVLDLKPGDAFVVRNVANLVPPYDPTKVECVGAAVEYAVLHLEVKNIVVMGHSDCGGIKALTSCVDEWCDPRSGHLIKAWVRIGMQARNRVDKEYYRVITPRQQRKCEKEAVNLSLRNLMTYPFVKERVDKKDLSLFGAYYDFVNVPCRFKTWKP